MLPGNEKRQSHFTVLTREGVSHVFLYVKKVTCKAAWTACSNFCDPPSLPTKYFCVLNVREVFHCSQWLSLELGVGFYCRVFRHAVPRLLSHAPLGALLDSESYRKLDRSDE